MNMKITSKIPKRGQFAVVWKNTHGTWAGTFRWSASSIQQRCINDEGMERWEDTFDFPYPEIEQIIYIKL